MAYADAYGNVEGFNSDEIEWNVSELQDYFDKCQKKYEAFLAMADKLMSDFNKIVDDPDHKGPEANSTKDFTSNVQVKLIEDIAELAQKSIELQDKLMQDFADGVDSSIIAVVKSVHLFKVINDFIDYYKTYTAHTSVITSIASGLNSECSEAGVSFLIPDPEPIKKKFLEFVSEDGKSGFLPEFKKVFEDFDSTHSADIDGSSIDEMCQIIEKNLDKLLSMNADCLKEDIKSFDNTGSSLDLSDPGDAFTGAEHDSYEQDIKDMQDYLKGTKDECLLSGYDPVDLCSGNFISEQEDLKIGGAYPVVFRRFYNALDKNADEDNEDRCNDIGRGWCHNFSMHLTRTDDDDIKISYPDNSIGTYIRKNGKKLHFDEAEFEPEVWVEEHGEPGELTVYADGYKVTTDYNIYTAFDQNGYLIAMGDEGKGEKLSVCYEEIETEIKTGQRDRRIAMVKARSGAFIRFTYNTENQISSVTDHTGRTVSYRYTQDGCLSEICLADGAVRRYAYDSNGRIIQTQNESGVISIQNRYDEQGRITAQIYPNQGRMSFDYDDKKRSCVATERNGNKVTYFHDALGRHAGTRYYDGEEKFRYNKRNQKISRTDKNGNTTRYTYDNRGHLTGIVDPSGNRISMTYNAEGKLSVLKGANGASWHYTYTKEGYPLEITNPLGNKTTINYENGKVVSFRDAENHISTFTYDAAENAESYTDANGITIYYSYDELGRIIGTSDAEGNATSYSYDEADRLTAFTDAAGNEVRYYYNASGKITRIVNSDGTENKWQYNAGGLPCVYIDEEGRVTSTLYNIMDKEEEITLPNGGAVRYEYDPLMRVTGITDPEGRKTSYTYDREGNLLTIANAEGVIVGYTYDVNGRVIQQCDAEGHLTKTEYNEEGMPTKDIDPAGGVTAYEYDALDRITAITDPLGARTEYTYTPLGRIATAKQPDGRVIEYHYKNGGVLDEVLMAGILQEKYAYDRLGRVSDRILTDGYTISYQYDAVGRVTQASGTDGKKVSYQYDAASRIISMTDCGNTTKYSYTPSGMLRSVTDALGNVTEYTYDQMDQLIRMEKNGSEKEKSALTDSMNATDIDHKGHVTIQEYNLAGDLTAVTDALGQKESYAYDQIGRMISKTDRDGYQTKFAYNKNGLLSGAEFADGRKMVAGYDLLNQLNYLNDWLGETRIENDALGRVLSVTDYQNRKVSYTYGVCGERKSITYPDGHAVEYAYDENLRLRKLTDGANVTDYRFDEAGRITQKLFPNGTGVDYTYYQGGLLKSLVNRDAEGVLDHCEYQYDENGNRTSLNRTRRGMDELSGHYQYGYDPLGRLISVQQDQNPERRYVYDAFSNRTAMQDGGQTVSYYYDALDRLMHTEQHKADAPGQVIGYSYDRRGNMTGVTVNGQLQKSFAYDAINQLTAAENRVCDRTARYVYNGLGMRVSAEESGKQISYLCDITREYHNLLERTVDTEKETFVYDASVVSMQKGGSDYYYLQDEMGSPEYLTGTDGSAVSAYAYDEFGQNLDPFAGSNAREYRRNGNILQPFAFTGYQTDEVSGLHFAQARYYDAGNGRFTAEDKVRGFLDSPVTQNHYTYCFGNPLNYVDLDGNFPNLLKKLDNAVVNAETSFDNSKAGKWASAHKELVGGAVMVAGMVIGAGVTALAGPAVGPALGGAIGGAISDVGQQYMTNGSLAKTNYTEVAISSATGALDGYVGGKIGKGVTDMAKQSGKVIFKYAAQKAGASALINGAGSYLNDWFTGNFDLKKSTEKAAITAGIAGGLAFAGHYVDTIAEGKIHDYADTNIRTKKDINKLNRVEEKVFGLDEAAERSKSALERAKKLGTGDNKLAKYASASRQADQTAADQWKNWRRLSELGHTYKKYVDGKTALAGFRRGGLLGSAQVLSTNQLTSNLC